jgi:hypothetical protein
MSISSIVGLGPSKPEIGHFVMAITSAEATVWHTAPRKWLELPHLAGEPAEAAVPQFQRAVHTRRQREPIALSRPCLGLMNVIQYLDAHRAVV